MKETPKPWRATPPARDQRLAGIAVPMPRVRSPSGAQRRPTAILPQDGPPWTSRSPLFALMHSVTRHACVRDGWRSGDDRARKNARSQKAGPRQNALPRWMLGGPQAWWHAAMVVPEAEQCVGGQQLGAEDRKLIRWTVRRFWGLVAH